MIAVETKNTPPGPISSAVPRAQSREWPRRGHDGRGHTPSRPMRAALGGISWQLGAATGIRSDEGRQRSETEEPRGQRRARCRVIYSETRTQRGSEAKWALQPEAVTSCRLSLLGRVSLHFASCLFILSFILCSLLHLSSSPIGRFAILSISASDYIPLIIPFSHSMPCVVWS